MLRHRPAPGILISQSQIFNQYAIAAITMTCCDHISTFPIQKLTPGTQVHKDDCMYCFDTPENCPKGIDICLECYQSFSRGPLNHTELHVNSTHHQIYLNLVKELKPEDERKRKSDGERSVKMAKLMITDSQEDDNYNTLTSIYCALCDLKCNMSEVSEGLQLKVDEIMNANSSTRSEEIKAWEQEIFPCTHSCDIQQTVTDSPPDLSKCGACDLKQNLWICLHCGSIGCGREQFGSSIPGNSHALAHYELTGHPVAVKLGSLSAAGSEICDSYCYKCNDEVKVPNVSACLLKFDIDVSKAVKTEKSLVEINLDQNLNWDFKLDGANGEKLQPVFGSGLTGMKNLGNLCYLNSVVQSLFSLNDYKSYFENKTFPPFKRVKDPSRDVCCQLVKMYDGLYSSRYSVPSQLSGDVYQAGIKPSTFKHLIGENHPEFQTQRQQDAYEFYLHLLDKIDNEVGLALNEGLKFVLDNKILCSKCNKGRIDSELVDSLSVPIVDENTSDTEKVDILEKIEDYFAVEAVEDYQCDECKEKTVAFKSSGFKTYPQSLVLNARRIQLKNWVPVKVDVELQVPDVIDLSSFGAPILEDGEQEFTKTNSTTFEPNPDAMEMLSSMGFPHNRAAKALYNTGNKSAEDAMNWLFEHLEDADIDAPLEVSESKESNEPSNEAIASLGAMGFSSQVSRKALILSKGDVNAAVEWLFSNPDDDGVIEVDRTKSTAEARLSLMEKLTLAPATGGNYKLKAIVCHKGSSPHTGHYVAYIRLNIDNQERWVLFNDEKVVLCDESSMKEVGANGYLYFFEKIAH